MNSYASISTAFSRTLQSTNTKSVIKYKQHLKTILHNKSVLNKGKLIQDKLNNNNNNTIKFQDYNQINDLNKLLISSMLKVERLITRYGVTILMISCPWHCNNPPLYLEI